MVRDSTDSFKSKWHERAAQRRSKTEWATTEVFFNGNAININETDEEVLTPGSVSKVALGEQFRSVNVYVTNGDNWRMSPSSRSAWHQKLCKVLVEVCQLDGSTKINPSSIQETPNHLLYLQLKIHGNRTFVGNTLHWREIGFAIQIKGLGDEIVKKYFAINLHSKRVRRSGHIDREAVVRAYYSTSDVDTLLKEYSIAGESDFPDYEQHSCCGGCQSGCGPVAWAQVFGYYDRIGASYYWPFSPLIYAGGKAPLKTMTAGVEKFVEDIRGRVETYCENGQGFTWSGKMHFIESWFRDRQGYRARVVSYLKNRKRKGTSGNRVHSGSGSWIEVKTFKWLQKNYPVILGFQTDSSGHYAVATKFRLYMKARRSRCSHASFQCSIRDMVYLKFFLHYGWAGERNDWMDVTPFSAHVAYLK